MRAVPLGARTRVPAIKELRKEAPVRVRHTEAASTALDAELLDVERAVPGWRSVSFWWPQQGRRLMFIADRSDGGHPESQVRISCIAERSGKIEVQATLFAAEPRGQRWRAWVRFIHTGEAGGVTGEAIALLSALDGCTLVVTGLLARMASRKRLLADSTFQISSATVHLLSRPCRYSIKR